MISKLAGLLLLATVFMPTASAGEAANVGVEFVTLGTGGGPVTRLKRSEPANALVVGQSVYLFDAGDGVQRQLVAAGFNVAQIKAVFLSHHHIDHTGGFAPMMATRWLLNTLPPLPVFGPPGTAGFVTGLALAFRPVELVPITIGGPSKKPMAESVEPKDFAPDIMHPKLVFDDGVIRVFVITNDHYHFPAGGPEAIAARSYSFRIEAGKRTIVYTGDTGPSARLERLAKEADVLVSEVIDLEGIRRELTVRARLSGPALDAAMAHMVEDHLTPEHVGRLASRAGVKQVILTHLVPGGDGEVDTAPYSDGVRAHFKGIVKVASDLDRF